MTNINREGYTSPNISNDNNTSSNKKIENIIIDDDYLLNNKFTIALTSHITKNEKLSDVRKDLLYEVNFDDFKNIIHDRENFPMIYNILNEENECRLYFDIDGNVNDTLEYTTLYLNKTLTFLNYMIKDFGEYSLYGYTKYKELSISPTENMYIEYKNSDHIKSISLHVVFYDSIINRNLLYKSLAEKNNRTFEFEHDEKVYKNAGKQQTIRLPFSYKQSNQTDSDACFVKSKFKQRGSYVIKNKSIKYYKIFNDLNTIINLVGNEKYIITEDLINKYFPYSKEYKQLLEQINLKKEEKEKLKELKQKIKKENDLQIEFENYTYDYVINNENNALENFYIKALELYNNFQDKNNYRYYFNMCSCCLRLPLNMEFIKDKFNEIVGKRISTSSNEIDDNTTIDTQRIIDWVNNGNYAKSVSYLIRFFNYLNIQIPNIKQTSNYLIKLLQNKIWKFEEFIEVMKLNFSYIESTSDVWYYIESNNSNGKTRIFKPYTTFIQTNFYNRGFSKIRIIKDDSIFNIPVNKLSSYMNNYADISFRNITNPRIFNFFEWKYDTNELYNLNYLEKYFEDNLFKLIKHLCNNDIVLFEYVLDWITWIFQHPGEKHKTGIFIYSHMKGV